MEFDLGSDFNMFGYGELENSSELKNVNVFIFEKELCVLLMISFIRNIMV